MTGTYSAYSVRRRLGAVLAGVLAVLPFGPAAGGTAAAAPAIAATPPMGWNSWNTFGCDISQDKIRGAADALVDSGMRDAGFRYVVIDDCWFDPRRGPSGELRGAPDRFPDGIRAVADYVHGKGLKFGIYEVPTELTCAQRGGAYPGSTGSRGHEKQDAATFAGWGVDYLKYDWCSPEGNVADQVTAFGLMRDALQATGRPIVLSINANSYRTDVPGEKQSWTGLANLSRTTEDIKATWDTGHHNEYPMGVKNIIEINAGLADRAGPGYWNDPDMLEVGVRDADGFAGLTAPETRTHLGMWAMMAAPLIAGNDVRSMDPTTHALLTNRAVIGIDQDPLGWQGRRIVDGDQQVWAKPLQRGAAVALYNRADDGTPLIVTDAGQLGLRAAPAYRVHDVFSGRQWLTRDVIAARVGPHDTALLRVEPVH